MERGKASVIVMLTILMLSLFEAYNWSLPFYGVSSASPLVHNINTGLNYTTIQAAIDAPETLDGHTLVCDAGNYTEFVDVYKSLNIIGAGPKVCFVMPPDVVLDDDIDIEVDSVNITGFTIITPGWGTGYFAIFMVGVSKCRIWGNVIIGDGAGIDLKGSSNNVIECNVIKCRDNGIYIRHFSNHNIITNNRLMNNYYGIQVWNSSNYNLIERNFINSSTWCGIRLNWLGSGYLPVEQNTIRDNIVSYCKYGFFLDSPSTSNVVTLNFVSDCSIHGIHLRQSNSSTIAHNTIISNVYGAYLESSYGNLIFDNFFNNTYNAWDNGGNNWNGTKALVIGGYNIIGGIYYGGNYWNNNPNPTDADGDGIGETPYNIAGGANIDHLPLVTQQPIIMIAYYPFDLDFDLPEVWPECNMTISNGTWRREFTKITHIVTQVPVNATYTLIYDWQGNLLMYQCFIESYGTRRFEFYAINPSCQMMHEPTNPLIFGKEVGAYINLTWRFIEPEILNIQMRTEPPHKYAVMIFWLDTNLGKKPDFAISSIEWEADGEVGKADKTLWTNLLIEVALKIIDQLTFDPDVEQTGCGPQGTNACPTVRTDWGSPRSSVNLNYTFAQIPEYSKPLAVSLLRNDALIPISYNCRMTMTNVENGTLIEPEFLFPQFAIPPGSYVLKISDFQNEYITLSYPVAVSVYAGHFLSVYPLKMNDLKPFAFSIAAEFYLAKSSFSGLVHHEEAKTLTVNISSEARELKLIHDWWGYFALPKDRMVKTLIAYSNGTPYQLTKFYNYTENLIGDYNIVCVRIPPEMANITLTYTIFGDINGDGKVDIKDVAIASRAFGSYPGHPPWNPVGDINYDLKVDIKDVAAVSKQYGKIDP